MQSIVESLLSGANVMTNRKLTRLDFDETLQRWHISYQDSETQQCQQAYRRHVMLCLPAPQLIEIEGNWKNSLRANELQSLESVQYSSR